jgi:rubrerythrin
MSKAFVCQNCSFVVNDPDCGTKNRNHCPNCLHSVHLDDVSGDRTAKCGGLMEPISVWVRRNGEWAVMHRCNVCGTIHSNRIAPDDNPLLLMSIAVRPLANPPVPLERIG